LLRPINTYIRERFFDEVYHFNGITNAQETAECLSGFDTYLIDERMTVSATEYYCPTLYASGWRLENISEVLWKLYYEHYMKPLMHRSWRMNQFIPVTKILLMDYLSKYETQITDDSLEDMILRSLEAAAIKPSILEYAV